MKFFLVLLYLSIHLIYAHAGTEIQNGGAGISINGQVATFYSTSMKIYPTPLQFNEDFRDIEANIEKLIISNKAKLELIQSITPSFRRRYYSVNENFIDPSLLQQIKIQYQEITKVPTENLTLFALTDPQAQITLLLPDYFKLTSAERQTILLHESLWLTNRVAGYSELLKIDQFAQDYFSFPYDCSTLGNFSQEMELIFNERLWSFGNSFICEKSLYSETLSTSDIPFSDFFDKNALNTFSKLLQISFKNLQSLPLQRELSAILENSNSIFFINSRNHLARELKKGIYIFIHPSSLLKAHLRSISDEQQRVNALNKALQEATFYYADFHTSNEYTIKISSKQIGEIIITTENNPPSLEE